MSKKVIRILVVDDSSVMRVMLNKQLTGDEFEVVATARDPFEARDMIIKHRPDVMTLDVQMPRMNGVEFLRKLMPQYPLPTIMVSAHTVAGAKTTLDALDAGAVDFVVKPSTTSGTGLDSFIVDLKNEIRIACKVDVKKRVSKAFDKKSIEHRQTIGIRADRSIVVIGASTGGTDALMFVLSRLPPDFPPVVVVQHMPSGFTKAFAERLDRNSAIKVVEGADGEEVARGKVIIAPGGVQCKLFRDGHKVRVACRQTEKIDGHCPSVTNLFHSAAHVYGDEAVGVIMTGMGKDGSEGMSAMKNKGSYNIAQDEESCVVYGMPKAAVDSHVVDSVLPLDRIAQKLVDHFKG